MNYLARHRDIIASIGCLLAKLDDGSVRIPFSGCQIWLGATNGTGKYGRGGYGIITANGKNLYAHRVSYELNLGAIPSGQFVCHRCDVRLCINPNHLFLSDPMGNHLDKVQKGRARSPGAKGDANATRKYPGMVRGENNGRAKLTAADIEAIRRYYASGIQQRALAKQYGVGQTQISRICRREAWWA